MKKVLHWLVDHWYVPVFVAGAVILWIVTRGKDFPVLDLVKSELAAIRAGAEARESAATLGAEKAAAKVKADHAAALARLSADQAAKAKELEDDPVALSRFLVRAARRG